MKKITFLFAALFFAITASATTLYLKPNSNWKKDNARFAAYFFGNGETWVNMTLTTGETDIYQVEAPTGYPNVIFCRMNPGAKENKWNNKWNQTSDLNVPTNSNTLYIVKENTWDKGGGSWSKYAIAGEPNVRFNNESSAKKGDTFIPDITVENIENPTCTYTVSFNGGTTTEFEASTGYLLAEYGKYEITVEVKSNGTGDVLAFATIEVRVAYDAYIAGTHNNWNQDNDDHAMIANEKGILSKTYLQMPKGTYTIKVVYKGTWVGFDKVDTEQSITCTEGVDENNNKNGNIDFTLNENTDLTIFYNPNADLPIIITNKNEIEDKPSTNIPDGTTLYLKPGVWTADNARFAAYFFGGDGELWLDMTDSNSDGIYEVTTQGIRGKVIFCRMNPDFTENGWNSGEEGENDTKRVWSQTPDLTYDGTNNQYNILDWENGEWAIFTPNQDDENNDSTTTTILFPADSTLYVTVHTEWTADNARFAAYFFGTNGNIWTNMTNIKDAVYSLTVPAGEWDGMIICRMNPNNTENRWNNDGEENGPFWGAQTQDIKYEEGKNHYVINSEDATWDGNKPGGSWTVYTPTENPTSVENITINNIYVQDGMIIADEEISIFTITGQNVTDMNGNLAKGVYVVKVANATAKVVVK